MRPLLKIFNNKWIKALILVTVLQQFLVARGTYLLGSITHVFPTEGLQIGTMIGLFFCIFLPGTVVHYFIVWCTTKAYKSAQLSYLNAYLNSNFNHPTHWRDQNSKNQRHDIMCRGGQETILSTVYFIGDLIATGFNIILNILSIALVTDVTFGIVIVVAGILGLSVVHLAGTRISETSRNEMLADNHLNAHLSKSWDNIILGNQFFFDRWKSYFDKLFVKTEIESLETIKKREWTVSLAAMVTNGLVLGYALIQVWLHQDTLGFVLAILVMLPRSLQIVMHIQIIQSYLAQWKRLEEKLKVTFKSILEPITLNLSYLINENNISVKTTSAIFPACEIENILNTYTMGRFTITGDNGVGKSSLLLNLKDKFPFSAYLPTQHQLMLCESQLSLSSGEIALASLKDLQSSDCKILLLDEWDANLSPDNRAFVCQMIDELSLKRIVVEVRHT